LAESTIITEFKRVEGVPACTNPFHRIVRVTVRSGSSNYKPHLELRFNRNSSTKIEDAILCGSS
jgi:hypothetical protein